MNRTYLVLALAASVVLSVGCTTKSYVRQQTTPIINKTNQLDDLTAKNNNERQHAGTTYVKPKTHRPNELLITPPCVCDGELVEI